MTMKNFLLRSRAYYSPPGEGGAGTDGGQQIQNNGGQQQQQQQQQLGNQNSGGGSLSPGGGGQPGGGQQQQQQQQGAQPYRPEGLPDHLFGANDKETIDKLFGAFNGFRQSQGDRGTLPKDPSGYQFEWGDKLKPYVANFDKDPVFAKTREIFHAAGVTDKQAQKIIGPWLEALIDGGLVDAPVDAQAQLMSLAPASAANLDEAGKKAAATQRINNNLAWVDGAKAQGIFPTTPDGKSPIADFFAAALASDPRAHLAVEWLRGQGQPVQPALNGGAAPSGVSKEQLSARINDPRNDPRSPKFEKAFAEETDRLTREMYPG